MGHSKRTSNRRRKAHTLKSRKQRGAGCGCGKPTIAKKQKGGATFRKTLFRKKSTKKRRLSKRTRKQKGGGKTADIFKESIEIMKKLKIAVGEFNNDIISCMATDSYQLGFFRLRLDGLIELSSKNEQSVDKMNSLNSNDNDNDVIDNKILLNYMANIGVIKLLVETFNTEDCKKIMDEKHKGIIGDAFKFIMKVKEDSKETIEDMSPDQQEKVDKKIEELIEEIKSKQLP